MKIIQTFYPLFLIIVFSCSNQDNKQQDNLASTRQKFDSIKKNREEIFDSVMKINDAISIHRIWQEIESKDGKNKILSRKNDDRPYQEIAFGLSTIPQVDIIWSKENERGSTYAVTKVIENSDSLIFQTFDIHSRLNYQWVFKHIDKKNAIGKWSIYDSSKQIRTQLGCFIGLDYRTN